MRMEAHSVRNKKPEIVTKTAPVDAISLGETLVMQPASNMIQHVDRGVVRMFMERTTGRLHLDCRSMRHVVVLSLVQMELLQLVVNILILRLCSTVPKPVPENIMGIERNSVELPAVGWLDTIAFPAALGRSDNADTAEPSMLK